MTAMLIWLAAGAAALAVQVQVNPTPTFIRDVAPILYKSCVRCHRPGEPAPMSLTTYDEARPWAAAIKRNVVGREMPPWFADPSASMSFRNDPRLTQREIDTIAAWVDGGAAKGDGDMPALPAAAAGWHHPSGRPPDYVVQLPQTFEVPADGVLPYQNFFVKVPFADEQWIEAAEARAGNPALVHHFAVSVVQAVVIERPRPPGGPSDAPSSAVVAPALPAAPRPVISATVRALEARLEAIRRQANRPAAEGTAAVDMVAVYVPGGGFQQYPSGVARRIRVGPNVYFNFNMHYQPTGRPESDRSMVGFWFVRKPVHSELIALNGAADTLIVQGQRLLATPSPGQPPGPVVIPNIPPYVDNFEVIGIKEYSQPIILYTLMPHAHLRAKDWKYELEYPDGRRQVILSVPKYDFNWQLVYALETPLRIPAGSKLVVTAHYDNSLKNKRNPAPQKEVLWNGQTWDEMFTPFVGFTLDADPTGDILH